VTSAVEVTNRTRVAVGEAAVAKLVDLVLAAEGAAGAEVGVTFVGERRMRALNRQHRARDAVTDVLAFPLEDEEEIAVVRDAEGGAAEAVAPDGPPRLLGTW
jgi:probable rRNA maturation factor